MLRSILSMFFLIGISVSSCANNGQAVPLGHVDLSRIGGGWYIVATIPNFLERGIVGPHDFFTLRSRRVIREDFYMQRGGFDKEKHHFTTRITVRRNTGDADWRVHILGIVSVPFQVLYVTPDYRFILFGEQNRRWGWIYSRSQTIGGADYRAMLAHFKALGYDTSKFRKFVQMPDQIGRPGYWSSGIR